MRDTQLGVTDRQQRELELLDPPPKARIFAILWDDIPEDWDPNYRRGDWPRFFSEPGVDFNPSSSPSDDR